jgi:hypothetical protein
LGTKEEYKVNPEFKEMDEDVRVIMSYKKITSQRINEVSRKPTPQRMPRSQVSKLIEVSSQIQKTTENEVILENTPKKKRSNISNETIIVCEHVRKT